MNKTENPRKALGKGLGALLPTRTQAPPPAAPAARCDRRASRIDPALSRSTTLSPIPLQPRRIFQNDRLAELAQSIRANGIIQPLVVRYVGWPLPIGGRGAPLARRQAGRRGHTSRSSFATSPTNRLLEITLIENIQREDLNPIETASRLRPHGDRNST